MKKVALQFPNLDSLWNFETTLNNLPLKVDIQDKVIIRHCMDEDITKAKERFHASILQVSSYKGFSQSIAGA